MVAFRWHIYFAMESRAAAERVPGHCGRQSSYRMPSQPQMWHMWVNRLEREQAANRRWSERWPQYKPTAATDEPWSTALQVQRLCHPAHPARSERCTHGPFHSAYLAVQVSKDLTSPRGTGTSRNWATGGMDPDDFAMTMRQPSVSPLFRMVCVRPMSIEHGLVSWSGTRVACDSSRTDEFFCSRIRG